MGSGKQPKKSDRPLINRPKKISKGSGVGGGSIENLSNNENLNLLCLPSFEIKLDANSFVEEGVNLNTDFSDSGEMIILLENKKIGVVAKKIINRINKCKSLGFFYNASLVKGSGKYFYARFIRYAKQ